MLLVWTTMLFNWPIQVNKIWDMYRPVDTRRFYVYKTSIRLRCHYGWLIGPKNVSERNSKIDIYWDHSFIRYAKSSEKLTFLTPWYAHVRVAYQGVRNDSFSENFAYAVNGWSLVLLSFPGFLNYLNKEVDSVY